MTNKSGPKQLPCTTPLVSGFILETREYIAHTHTLTALRQKVLDPLKQIARNTICLQFVAQLLWTDTIKSLSIVYIANCDRMHSIAR